MGKMLLSRKFPIEKKIKNTYLAFYFKDSNPEKNINLTVDKTTING